MTEWALAQGWTTKAWVQAQGYLTTSFIDRGDPATPDFAVGDFLQDGAWHEKNLSAIVPVEAKAILIRLKLTGPVINSSVAFRERGNFNEENVSKATIQVAPIETNQDMVFSIDPTRIIDYKASNVVFFEIELTVKGWWI